MINLVEYYYTNIYGYYPFEDDNAKLQCKKVIDYLYDCNYSESKVLSILEDCNEDIITFNSLPDYLWDNSLLKRDVFYFHSILHILSKPPKWDPITNKMQCSKFYMEMRIDFNIKDLLNYFYDSFNIEEDLKDIKRDEGSLKYLLSKYKFDFIEPVDFILYLIDYAKNADENNTINSILKLSEYESAVHEALKRITTEASISKADHIIWR